MKKYLLIFLTSISIFAYSEENNSDQDSRIKIEKIVFQEVYSYDVEYLKKLLPFKEGDWIAEKEIDNIIAHGITILDKTRFFLYYDFFYIFGDNGGIEIYITVWEASMSYYRSSKGYTIITRNILPSNLLLGFTSSDNYQGGNIGFERNGFKALFDAGHEYLDNTHSLVLGEYSILRVNPYFSIEFPFFCQIPEARFIDYGYLIEPSFSIDFKPIENIKNHGFSYKAEFNHQWGFRNYSVLKNELALYLKPLSFLEFSLLNWLSIPYSDIPDYLYSDLITERGFAKNTNEKSKMYIYSNSLEIRFTDIIDIPIGPVSVNMSSVVFVDAVYDFEKKIDFSTNSDFYCGSGLLFNIMKMVPLRFEAGINPFNGDWKIYFIMEKYL